MNITTKTLSGAEICVEIGGQNTEIRNDGAATVYASANAGIVAGADGVVAIPAGAAVTVLDTRGRVYLLGTGEVSVVGKDTVAAVFKCAPSAGGSGEDEEARQAITTHAGNLDIHVTAEEKAAWNDTAAHIPSGGTSGQILGINNSGEANWQTHRGIDVGKSTTGTVYTIDGTTYTAETGAEVFNDYTRNNAIGKYSHAEGYITTASGANSHAEGYGTTASSTSSHAEGVYTKATSYASHAGGKRNKAMTDSSSIYDNTGDVFVIGNGTSSSATSNAFRVTYEGAVYGLSAFNSSGADYAEFIKPWADGNPDGEDRVGYFVTIKDGLLQKANEGEYIVGITSGNPSIIGNADEDYYWRYERDDFNRFVYEDAEEEVEQTDENGNLVLDESGEPVMIKTGKIIKNAHYKLAADYDSTKQNSYVERKNRPEWSYVGMIGVIPVRDDGSCEVGGFCKCGNDGIATKADTRAFDTFFVIERISEHVVSVEMR